MAGIGFVLKRLANRDDLLGVLGAFNHGTVAAAGPWLFTVVALAGIVLLFPGAYNQEDVLNFRETIVYNFSTTLMLSGPVYLVVTRYLADAIHRQRVVLAPTVLLQSIAFLMVLLIPFGLWFYFSFIQLSFPFRLAAYANLILTGATWLLGVFVLALKDYMAVSRTFFIGMVIAFVGAQIFKAEHGGLGMLIGFDIGQAYILFALIAKVFAEYPFKIDGPTKLHLYFQRYWQMIFAGFFYNAAIWIDKWIMWFCAPEATILDSGFRFFSLYDNATFLALLSIVPAIGLFIFSVETNFFLRYQRFYYDILEHKTLSVIRENHAKLIGSIKESGRNFIVLQGSITILAILLATKIFEVFDVPFRELGIFRIATLGAFFHALMLFAVIILSYFDCRKSFMNLHAFFFVTNALFTFLSIVWGGFEYYGFGYFLSALSTFLLAAMVLFDHVRKLPYHAFITNNNSLKQKFAGIDEE
jgi:uncharacterized membrane protein